MPKSEHHFISLRLALLIAIASLAIGGTAAQAQKRVRPKKVKTAKKTAKNTRSKVRAPKRTTTLRNSGRIVAGKKANSSKTRHAKTSKTLASLAKAKKAATVEYSSGLKVSGKIITVLSDAGGEPYYMDFSGPTKLLTRAGDLPGHGVDTHSQGFGSPVGNWKNLSKKPESLTSKDLGAMGITKGKHVSLNFESGVKVEGTLVSATHQNGKLILMRFKDVTASRGSKILYKPEWGSFDMAVGATVAKASAN